MATTAIRLPRFLPSMALLIVPGYRNLEGSGSILPYAWCVISVIALAATLLVGQSAAPGDTILVKDDGVVRFESGQPSVLGWRRVPAELITGDDNTVPDAYLDLLGPEPGTEPFGTDQWALDKIGLAGAWAHTLGEAGVVIAVIDSGVEMSHPELAARVFTNPGEIAGNDIDDDANGLVDDVKGWDIVDEDADPTDVSIGHGTEATGVAVASFNSIGMAGIAPRAAFLPIRACSTRCELIDVAWAVVYAVDMGADIINLSLGGFAEPGPLGDAIDYAEAAGVLVVAAAGNSGVDIDGSSFIPAGLPNPNLVSVAATTRDDELWTSSNFGDTTVDVGAPGAEIVTTTLSSLGQYRTVSGTSFAAPHVSGVAALMLAINPDLSAVELIDRLGSHGTLLGELSDTTVHGTRLRADYAVIAARLDDIHESIFDPDIVWLAAAGITEGCNPPTNTLFCPERPVTRGEVAAFLQRGLELEPGPDAFSDDTASEFHSAINALAATGITKGCNPPTNTLFCPERPMTRGEMAAFFSRALDLAAGPDAFDDDDASIFSADINALAGAGITRGCNPPQNDKFCPARLVTRAEMAAFLHRALG